MGNGYRITRIEPQKKRENRMNIYLDGAFAFGLDQEVVLRHHMHEGDELTETLIDDILLVEERTRAKEKALSFLNYRARSETELRNKLKAKQFSERTIQRVIDDLIRVGLLNDEQFAASYVHSRMVQKPVSKRLLRQELLSKGIDEELAAAAIETGYGPLTETQVARDLIRKRSRRISSSDEDEQKRRKKLTDFLKRRGFKWDVISEAMHEGA